MKDHRDHDRPFSADSNRNVPGRLAANFRYADTGVSLSASTFRVTGTTRCSAASARKSSRDVVAARLAIGAAGLAGGTGERSCTGRSSQTGRDGRRGDHPVKARASDDGVAGVTGLVSMTGD